MITREYINDLKAKNNGELNSFINEQKDNSSIQFILENLGRLPLDFDGHCLIPFLMNKHDNIRYLTVKNIGKLCNDKYLELILKVAKEDQSSFVRREAISTIGRMKSEKAIPFLIEMLKGTDPKVVLQVIRALLVFKSNSIVQEELKKLANHSNEMIQYVIQKQFYTKKSIKYLDKNPVINSEFMKNVVVYGDVLETLKYVPDESINLTFTSPPYYNARDYSIYPSYKEYILFLAAVFKEIYRVTKEGRFFILNTSPVIIPRVSRQHSSKRYPIPFDIHYYLIKMGWEFIDDIIWVKPEASVKNRIAGFSQHRKPLAYKPNQVTEYVMVYRKKTDKLLDWNIRQYDWEIIKKSKVQGEYETTNVWRIDPTFDKVHSAVFPIELCSRIVKFYSYVGDLVFDPFAGSGTLGRAALNLERYFFLTEKEEKYIEKIKHEINKETLFINKKIYFLDILKFKKLMEGNPHDFNG
ncbi:MAG: HEAT repeat domain-containing protein [Candidatus Marinimicrobia bacterium]|nr:HEAT repeat domain-containing protein [Candidatus Neomarinimicrobiota bacterium]